MSRYLGLDHGEKRIGLALSDPLKIIATPYKTLSVSNSDQIIQDLEQIKKEKDIELVVVGLPLGMRAQETERTKQVRVFVEKLVEKGFKVILEDERLSSISAKRVLIEKKIKTGYNKKLVDQTAAAIILQQYLDKQLR